MNIDKTNVDKIWLSVNKIYDSKLLNKLPPQKFEDNMALYHDYLYSNFPSLFKMVGSNLCDLDRIKFMLDNIVKIQSNQMTEHDASVKVGENLVNDFVKPQLNDKKNKKKNKK